MCVVTLLTATEWLNEWAAEKQALGEEFTEEELAVNERLAQFLAKRDHNEWCDVWDWLYDNPS